MSDTTNEADELWQPSWAQAMSDFHAEDDEAPFENVTARMTVPASIGGDRVRVELSNQFGTEPALIGRAAIGTNGQFVDLEFGGKRAFHIPAGRSLWTDPIALPLAPGDDIDVDLFLPVLTPYATAGGFTFARSIRGDFTGSSQFPVEGAVTEEIDKAREFPATNTGANPEPDGTDWSLPAGGPFLRTIDVAGTPAKAVIVCLGSSSTAMGWPQYTAAALPADANIAVVNRGIAGNRLRLDAPGATPSWGRAGLSRFDDDVLGTDGVTHVVIAYNSNDWGLPGRVTDIAEMPTGAQMIDAYQQLIDRSVAAGIIVILGTTTPLAPEAAGDSEREGIRSALNEWMRTSVLEVVDFDAAIRCPGDPSRLEEIYAAPDHTHPNINGQKRLARAMVDVITRMTN